MSAVKVDRDMIAAEIQAAIDRSTTMSDRDKRRASRVMDGRFRWQQRARQQVIDKAVIELLAEELIVPTPEGVEAAVDWDSIATFIERILPLILQLITLFGG